MEEFSLWDSLCRKELLVSNLILCVISKDLFIIFHHVFTNIIFYIILAIPSIFDVDLEKVNLKKVSITDIIPDFMTNIILYTSKVGHKFRHNSSGANFKYFYTFNNVYL
jgi:hypothetical protein